MIKPEVLTVTIELDTEQMGTAPKNKEVYSAYVARKAADLGLAEQEVANVEQVEESGWTGFLTDTDGIYIPDYMIRGSLKAACENAQATGEVAKIPAYSKWMDRLVFVTPRKIRPHNADGEQIVKPHGVIERSIRANTPLGPRVALVKSDYLNSGTQYTFNIEVLPNSKKLSIKLMETLLSYGRYYGLGQWRGSGGCGRFSVV